MRSARHTAAAAMAAALSIVGCSSSDSGSTKATTAATAATTRTEATQPAGSPGTAPASGSGDAGIALPTKDAQYNSGRLHVEFGGDSGGAAEIDGTGVIIGGFANFVFSDDTRQASVIFGMGTGQPGVVSFTWDGTTSGGEFGKECNISFTKSDAAALEASFTCTGMHGVKLTSTDDQSVDAKGTFTLSA